MSRLIKILHVDPDFKVTYFIYGPGSSIRTPVPLQTAIDLLKKVDFDLILSEPHNKAILKKKTPKMEPNGSNLMVQPFYGGRPWRSREVRSQSIFLVRRIGQGNRTVSKMDRPNKNSRLIHKKEGLS